VHKKDSGDQKLLNERRSENNFFSFRRRGLWSGVTIIFNALPNSPLLLNSHHSSSSSHSPTYLLSSLSVSSHLRK
jgi:hypothetical protein